MDQFSHPGDAHMILEQAQFSKSNPSRPIPGNEEGTLRHGGRGGDGKMVNVGEGRNDEANGRKS